MTTKAEEFTKIIKDALEERSATKAQAVQSEQIKQLFIEVKDTNETLKDFVDNKFIDCQNKCRDGIQKNDKAISVMETQIKIYTGIGAGIGALIGGVIVGAINMLIGKGV